MSEVKEPTTLQAAKEAGYHMRKPGEYGGEEIRVKEHVLVRGTNEARSKKEWSQRGFKILKEANPHCTRKAQVGDRAKSVTYHVYREDQVEPKRKVTRKPAVQIEDLAALWVINRRAKRCRDLASKHYRGRKHGFARSMKDEKERLYHLKSQMIHHMVCEGRLHSIGFHVFPGGNWAEILRGGEFRFHRPCESQDGEQVEKLDEIDAKPRGAKSRN